MMFLCKAALALIDDICGSCNQTEMICDDSPRCLKIQALQEAIDAMERVHYDMYGNERRTYFDYHDEDYDDSGD